MNNNNNKYETIKLSISNNLAIFVPEHIWKYSSKKQIEVIQQPKNNRILTK